MADLSQMSTDDLLAALKQKAAPTPKGVDSGKGYSQLGALGARMVNTATFGVGEEITSAAIATVLSPFTGKTWGQEYDKELAMQRGDRARVGREMPITSGIHDVVGGFASPVASAGATAVKAAPSLLPQAASGAKAGAAYGALSGFGTAEGGTGNRLRGAAGGALVGGALGAAAPVIVEGTRAGYRAGRAALGYASPDEIATGQIARAIDRSGMSADDIANRVQEGQDIGVPLTPADTSLSMRRLARSVETVPGRASEATTRLLDERQAGQPGRVAAQLKRAVGNDGEALGMAETIIARRKQDADPLYKISNEASGVWSEELDSILKTPAARRGYALAKTIAANERIPSDEMAVIGYRLKPGNFGSYGKFKGAIEGETPTMRSWDYVKQGIDQIIESARDTNTGKLKVTPYIRSVLKAKADLVRELDRINPAYAQARQVFSGHSEMLDALHVGREFARGDIEMVARRFNEMTPGEQEMFRVGAVRELRSLIEKSPDGADVVRRLFSSTDKRARLALLFESPEQFQAFSRVMELEREATKTARTVMGGSPTGRIEAEQSDLMTGAIEDAISGHGVIGTLHRAGVKAITKAKGINDETAGKIASYIFNPNPDAIRRTADEADIAALLARNATIRATTKRAGTAIATTAGAAFAPRD